VVTARTGAVELVDGKNTTVSGAPPVLPAVKVSPGPADEGGETVVGLSGSVRSCPEPAGTEAFHRRLGAPEVVPTATSW
jgi:hypothetical protein